MANDTRGNPIPDDAAHSFTWNSDGTVATITKSIDGMSWIDTFTYSGGRLSSNTGWVPQ